VLVLPAVFWIFTMRVNVHDTIQGTYFI
jgi:hypothetical protein